MESNPRHVGIILDGNRRYARELMKTPWYGHKAGIRKAREVLTWAEEFGIPYVSAYVLSAENYRSRPKRELEMILKYFGEELDVILTEDHPVHTTKTRVRFIGRLEMLPLELQKQMHKVESLTSRYSKHFLTVCVAYGGQQEIVDACRAIAERVSGGTIRANEIDERLFAHYLYMNGEIPYPDMIVRTGGEKRLSNFLIWQSAYAELFFVDKRWPELDKRTFVRVLDEYRKRQRRFGK
ncbi:MAG: di-trans,poly-cis-decaprenylcistransferase [Candidatus Aenigmatarchaeota archaeon]|nr:MAG: di-trans,poly-cis-decaprenylcistransferase [Candidatus Aenigmarchaeota archaeon]